MATRVNVGRVVQRGMKNLLKVEIKIDPKAGPQIAARVNKSADRAYEATCKTLNQKLVSRTPRATGRAQAGWNASIGKTDSSERDRFTKKGAYPRAQTIINENNRVFRGIRVTQQGRMANGVPYIRFLEDGRSQQRPQGWIKMTLMEMFGVFPKHYAQLWANGYTRDLGGGEATSL